MTNESYLVFDSEFSIKKHYKRVGHFQYNKLVAVGFKSSGEEQPLSKWVSTGSETLVDLLIDEKVLVGHNLKIDLLMIWHLEGLQDAFKRGLKVWCTQLAEYMLSGQKDKFSALREIAVRKYRCKERAKLMEAYWDQGIDTCDIPKEIVLNDVENDVLDTEAIYKQQVIEAKDKGMFVLIEAHNDTLLALAECEYNGMRIDRGVLHKNKQELLVELEDLEKKLNKLAMRYWK